MHEARRPIPLQTLATLLVLLSGAAGAGTPADQQKRFADELRGSGAAAAGFSAARGEAFFKSAHGGEWSCSSCHSNPLAAGKHARTGKAIAPLAPAANRERFTDSATVDKWFRRNCNEVLGRACTAQEKGDVLQYLMSLE
jgi:hypothetical protein